MELPVEMNGNRQIATVAFAGRKDLGFVAEWRKTLGEDKNPFRKDALDFAQLAVYRFEAHSDIQAYVNSISDIGDHIKSDQQCEIAGIAIMKCDWFPDSKIIGLAHFRRNWCNNIILDYLAAHPFIAKRPETYPIEVHNVGTALLYFISQIAKRYECGVIWGEATHDSRNYYKRAFHLKPVTDLIFVPREHFLGFIDEFDKEWVADGKKTSNNNTADDKISSIETTHPPFVGSKTAVFNPARRLAYRFLDLPDHIQTDIARTLGLMQSGDETQPLAERFRRFFQRATATGKLPDLWQEVEKRYPDGQADINPFPSQ